MSTANGTVTQTGPNSFEGKFTIDGAHYTYSGSSEADLPEFFSPDAVLIYIKAEDLRNEHPYKGVLGVNTIAIVFDNQASINGDLVQRVFPGQSIEGKGKWTVA